MTPHVASALPASTYVPPPAACPARAREPRPLHALPRPQPARAGVHHRRVAERQPHTRGAREPRGEPRDALAPRRAPGHRHGARRPRRPHAPPRRHARARVRALPARSTRITPDVFKRPAIDDDRVAYVMQRIRQTHDLWHVLTGYTPDVSGELLLQVFTFAQLRVPSALAIAVIGSVRVFWRSPDYLHRVRVAYRRGQQTRQLAAFRWEDHWADPLGELRARLGCPPELSAHELPERAAAAARPRQAPRGLDETLETNAAQGPASRIERLLDRLYAPVLAFFDDVGGTAASSPGRRSRGPIRPPYRPAAHPRARLASAPGRPSSLVSSSGSSWAWRSRSASSSASGSSRPRGWSAASWRSPSRRRPVLASVVVTARAGSTMASELGTMRVSEQIDAITIAGRQPPPQYLVARHRRHDAHVMPLSPASASTTRRLRRRRGRATPAFSSTGSPTSSAPRTSDECS